MPGRAGVPGNEEAGATANRGKATNEGPNQKRLADLASAHTTIRQVCRRRWAGTYHEWVPPEYSHHTATEGRPLKANRGWTRREQQMLHQLRTDRCPLLRDTLRRWKTRREPARTATVIFVGNRRTQNTSSFTAISSSPNRQDSLAQSLPCQYFKKILKQWSDTCGRPASFREARPSATGRALPENIRRRSRGGKRHSVMPWISAAPHLLHW